MARISPSRKSPKLTTPDPDRLFSTCRAGFRVFRMRPMQSATYIHDARPLREKIPEGLGNIQPFSGTVKALLKLRLRPRNMLALFLFGSAPAKRRPPAVRSPPTALRRSDHRGIYIYIYTYIDRYIQTYILSTDGPSQVCSPNPPPSTLNSQLSTLNLQPSTLKL